MAKISSNATVNLLSNQDEKLSTIQQKIREQAKLEIFQTLDLDNRKFTDIADIITNIKRIENNSGETIKINSKNYDFGELNKKSPYKEIFEKYKDSGADEKEKMYMEISERIILANGGVISYKDGEKVGKYTIDKDFVKKQYDMLNSDSKYKGKLDFFTVRDSDGKLYIIKRTDKEMLKIYKRENELLNEKLNEASKDTKDNDENKKAIEELRKRLDEIDNKQSKDENHNKNNDNKDIKNKNTELNENNEKEKEEFLRRLKEYCPRLFEGKDKTEKSEYRKENRESVEKNSLYVSRKDVEMSVLASRRNSDFPVGNVEIKGTYVKVEEFQFYEEIKQEYILAKGDPVKLAELDKKLAELIILSSPRGADTEKRYQICLTEEEIVAGGLVVSSDFLAKYGIAVDYFEYTNTIIEREYREKMEILKKIETEIQDLTLIITELTTKVNIEKYSSEKIKEEIKIKKEKLLMLIAKQKALLISLRAKTPKKYITKIVEDTEKQNGELLFEFTDTSGNIFYNECKTRKIKRIDGKRIKESGDIDTVAEYIDSEGRILKLEPAYGSDGDYDSPLVKYKFVYTGKKQIREEIGEIGLGEFEVGEYGELFAGYCRDNGITREDGKEIKDGRDIDTSAIYLKDGKRLKLEFRRGGAFGGDDNTRTTYEFVYYEESELTGENEIERELQVIVKESEGLYKELEELENKLSISNSESEKIEIKKQIQIIQERLISISKKITEFTNTEKVFKESITQHRYAIVKPRVLATQTQITKPFEMTSVISDMGTDVFREKAALRSEERLKAYYKSLGRWQVGRRLSLFLGRGLKRKKLINTYMNNMSKNPFQTDAGYGALNEQSQNAADRHEHELATGMEAINKITTVHNQQVDQLCKDYLNNIINDSQFQQQFNQIIANDANVQNALNGQSITHIGTNILLRLQEQKALNQLILDMDAQLAQYVATGNVVHMDNMRNYVSQFIKDYQKTPAFMANFEQFVKGDLNARNQLRQYLNHQRAVMQMQITNLRMNIDILNKGKSAYQIDNKDRETGKGSWKFKLGHFMDKHPRGTAIASTAISVGIGLGTGLIASPVVAGALSLGLFGGLVGTTNAVKKWTHHTKEQNTHEKNVATDYRNEQAKIQAWQNQALNGHGWRKYKAKRQLALYDQTTQENIRLSDQITEYITNLSSKVGPLTADEDNFMRCNLIEGWARLKYYRQMGHNFLASEQVDKTEKDMKRLEKAITLGLQKIGKTTNDIETNMNATNQLGTNITYAVIQNDLKASYDKSLIQFKRERRNLSLKYGFGTAIASIGIGAFFQWITGTGIAAKEIPGTPGTPGAPETTTSHAGGTDNFGLGKSNLALDPSLGVTTDTYNQTVSAISGAPNGSTVNFIYGVGTDATPVIPGHLTASDLTSKLSEVSSNIGAMSGLTTAQKNAFLTELSSLSHSGFTNNNLASMRAAEYLEHCAQAMSDVGNTSLIPTFSRTLGASGGTYNNLAERFMTGAIDITTPAIPGTPGTPPIPGKRRGRWFMGMPLFFNTFKDRKSTKDTTDQNFGRGGQQSKQPQANPNPQQHP